MCVARKFNVNVRQSVLSPSHPPPPKAQSVSQTDRQTEIDITDATSYVKRGECRNYGMWNSVNNECAILRVCNHYASLFESVQGAGLRSGSCCTID